MDQARSENDNRRKFYISRNNVSNFTELGASFDGNNDMTLTGQWIEMKKIINFIIDQIPIAECEIMASVGRHKMSMPHEDSDLYCVPYGFKKDSIMYYSRDTRPYINFCCTKEVFWKLMMTNSNLIVAGHVPYLTNDFPSNEFINEHGIQRVSPTSTLYVKGCKLDYLNEEKDFIPLDEIKLFYKSGQWKTVTGVSIIAGDYEPDSDYIKAVVTKDDPHDSEMYEIYLIHPEFGCRMKTFRHDIIKFFD